ncbi:uncharacterized protein V3H82_026034 [Fundulus diaphanus]
MGHRESGDVVVGMGVQAEDPLLLLITHCREMKQQEARLRIATLLLLLGCAALVVFNCADFTHRRAAMAVVSSPAPSIQNPLNPAARLSTPSPLRIDLRSIYELEGPVKKIIQWDPVFGGEGGAYDNVSRAIVIPATGQYFVYMRFMLCPCDPKPDKTPEAFVVMLQSSMKGYDEVQNLTYIREDHGCQDKSVYMGQLFELQKGDQLRVFLEAGYELIRKSSFGAFLT